jgi:coenzyme F420-reducing hydrogenase delta subunit
MDNQVFDITLFYCTNSFTTQEIHSCASKIDSIKLNAISLPCSGKVNLLYLLKAIETGSDGVIILTCRQGECKYLQGNLRAQKRIEAVDNLLEESGLGSGCIKCINLPEEHKTEALANEIVNFCKQLKTKTELVKGTI